MGYGEGFLFYIAVIAAPVCAFLSVNDKFKNLFLSLINAYGTTYLLSLILRLTYLVCIIVGVVLYFIFLFLNLSTFGLVLGKIYAGTLSGIALIDVWGLLSILGALHGVTTSNTSFAISCLAVFLIFSVVSLGVIIPTYFQNWANKKVAEYQAGSGEAQPAV
jgi:signal transduction histidine kinase